MADSIEDMLWCLVSGPLPPFQVMLGIGVCKAAFIRLYTAMHVANIAR